MQRMGRFQRSWELAKQSWSVLRSHPALAVFPIVSTIVTVVLSASFFIPLTLAVGIENLENPPLYAYVLTFLYYLVTYFLVIFFNAGLIHCANEVMHGRNADFGDGINASVRRIGPILVWSLTAATVGTILRSVAERTGIIGQIVIGLIGAAWNILTFFTLPMLVIEGVGPVAAIKGSFATLKKTWGETIIGNVGISYAIGILCLVPIPLIILVAFTGIWQLILLTIAIALIYWLALGAVGASMTGIYTVAVFSYAQTGEVPIGFDSDQIRNAFLPKPPSKMPFSRRR